MRWKGFGRKKGRTFCNVGRSTGRYMSTGTDEGGIVRRFERTVGEGETEKVRQRRRMKVKMKKKRIGVVL